MTQNGTPSLVIAGAARTPIGMKCGTLSGFAAEDLATCCATEAIKRSGIDVECIDAAFGANVYQFTAPGTQDIYFARNVALRCDLRTEVPALLVQRICGSGLQTVVSAFQQIALPDTVDDTKVALCFGGETMSRTPLIKRASRRSAASFWEFDDNAASDDSILTSLAHNLAETSMMLTADEYGSRMGITRQECDEFAVMSQERAQEARRHSYLNGGDRLRGLFAVDSTDLSGRAVHLASDECIRETSLETLQKLPGFTPHGLVSPGNASEISDGAGALVVADRARAEELGLPMRFELAGYGIVGVDPKIMGSGPVPAIRQALKRAGLSQQDIGLWEINEAFAAQYLAVEKELELDRGITNVNGGAIAIGHPLAATGARLLVDLMYEMDRRDVQYGCASACIGGGQGLAVIIRDSQGSSISKRNGSVEL